MTQSEDDIQRKFFGEFFGFKVGDRVKIKRRVYGGNGRHFKRWYWKYGTIIIVFRTSAFNSSPFRVEWDGERLSSTYSASQLIKVRPYGKET